MPDITDSIREHPGFDLRKAFPELMAKLGVNQADERAVAHATIAYVLKVLDDMAATEVKDVV